MFNLEEAKGLVRIVQMEKAVKCIEKMVTHGYTSLRMDGIALEENVALAVTRRGCNVIVVRGIYEDTSYTMLSRTANKKVGKLKIIDQVYAELKGQQSEEEIREQVLLAQSKLWEAAMEGKEECRIEQALCMPAIWRLAGQNISVEMHVYEESGKSYTNLSIMRARDGMIGTVSVIYHNSEK